MGTSNKYGGPKGSNPLIPSWLGDADGIPSPPAVQPSVPPPVTPLLPGMPKPPEPKPEPRSAPQAQPSHMTGPRKAFNNFVRSGGQSYLRTALSGYVRRGTGSSRTAVVRMGPSRQAARTLYQFIQTVNNDGLQIALASISRDDLFGKSAADVLGALTDAICAEGGLIDDAIAREAWDEAVLFTLENGTEDIGTMSEEEWEALFCDFIARSIEMKVFNDICTEGVSLPESVAEVNQVENDLHALIGEAVTDSIGENFSNNERLDENQIKAVVDDIYSRAFVYLSTLDEEE